MKYILYFRSRANFSDKSTWAKELCPNDYTIDEIRQATHLSGCEGFAIIEQGREAPIAFEWIKHN